jgi:LacI family transcriptional regulator
VIGYVVDRVDDSYQNELMSALVGASARLGVSMLCFAGGNTRGDTSKEAPRTRLYDLIGPWNLDALVLSSATLESGIGPERVSEFARRFADLPVVSNGLPLAGASSVVVDNAAGFEALVGHMEDAHHAQRIALIRGPSTNDEAEARYLGYLAALRARSIAPNPDLIVEGDFLPHSG